jgi:hypothetical protein
MLKFFTVKQNTMPTREELLAEHKKLLNMYARDITYIRDEDEAVGLIEKSKV